MSKLVMVVDDEEDFLYEVKRMLERDRLKVVTAINGEEALKMLKSIKPDLILLDVMMPEMDGWTLAKKIKDLPAHSKTTIAIHLRTR